MTSTMTAPVQDGNVNDRRPSIPFRSTPFDTLQKTFQHPHAPDNEVAARLPVVLTHVNVPGMVAAIDNRLAAGDGAQPNRPDVNPGVSVSDRVNSIENWAAQNVLALNTAAARSAHDIAATQTAVSQSPIPHDDIGGNAGLQKLLLAQLLLDGLTEPARKAFERSIAKQRADMAQVVDLPATPPESPHLPITADLEADQIPEQAEASAGEAQEETGNRSTVTLRRQFPSPMEHQNAAPLSPATDQTWWNPATGASVENGANINAKDRGEAQKHSAPPDAPQLPIRTGAVAVVAAAGDGDEDENDDDKIRGIPKKTECGAGVRIKVAKTRGIKAGAFEGKAAEGGAAEGGVVDGGAVAGDGDDDGDDNNGRVPRGIECGQTAGISRVARNGDDDIVETGGAVSSTEIGPDSNLEGTNVGEPEAAPLGFLGRFGAWISESLASGLEKILK